MRLNKDFVMRTVAGQMVLINDSAKRVDFNGILSMNEPAAWLWKKISDSDVDFDAETLASWLLEEYEITPEIARQDVDELIDQWLLYGVVR